MPRGRSQIPFYGQCPENEMPHMQRGPCFTDNYGKMDGHCGMGVSEFKSPMMANADPPPAPPKKKRRTSNTMAAAAQPPPSPVMQDLLPPPLTGYGDTIVASNPFDDTPPQPSPMSHMGSMNHVSKHMPVGPCMSPAAPMMGSISPCHIVGSPMNCGPPVGSPINCGPPMGNCSPMGGNANPQNCGPVGSPHCNTRQVSRSPLVCPPMSSGMNCGPPNSSPLNSVHPMNRSPSSLGSPLSSVMAPNVRGNSPLDCGGLGINSVGSQKGSPMPVMGSHNMNNLNCGSPMGSPSNVSLNSCNNGNMNIGFPITSPLGNVPCSLNSGSDLGILNGVMNRSPMNAPPNSVGSPMLCGSSMRGPSPISGGPMGNNPMGMNCNAPPGGMMGPKNDMNMNDLAMSRDNCGPGHISMKQNAGGNMPMVSCSMPMNNPCSRPNDMNSMPCGPGMNNPHCNPMMNSSQCGPGMNNMQCMSGGMNRPPPCGNPMGMGGPYEGGMNPQCRPNMNRSQFPRGMNNMHYVGPNNMSNMCGPNDMGGMPCGPNNNNIHCNDSSLSNSPCMSNNMNPCSTGNMFNAPYPFEARCNPNMNFNSNEMGNMNGFYRSMNNVNNAPCGPPTMHNPCSVSSANDMPNSSDVRSIKKESRDSSDLPAVDIASCGIPSVSNENSNDDLSLLCGNEAFMPEKRNGCESDERKPKDCNGSIGLTDDCDNKLESAEKSKADGEKRDSGSEEKCDPKGAEDEERKSSISPSSCGGIPASTANTSAITTTTGTTSSAVSTNCTLSTNATSTVTGTTTSTSVTSSEHENGDSANSNKSSASDSNIKTEKDDDVFKGSDVSNGSSSTNEKEDTGANGAEPKIKEESESNECVSEGDASFGDGEKKARVADKNGSNDSSDSISNNTSCGSSEKEPNGSERSKENSHPSSIKIENDDFYDDSHKGKNHCPPPNSGFGSGNNNNVPTTNFGPSGNDVLNNTSACMNDSLCGSPVLPDMNRTPMPNALNHSMNYPPNSMPMPIFPGKVYPANKSKIFNLQNPNAPPIYACGKCHQEINDNEQAIMCELGCKYFFHRTCSGLSEAAFQLLRTEVFAEWICNNCLSADTPPVIFKS